MKKIAFGTVSIAVIVIGSILWASSSSTRFWDFDIWRSGDHSKIWTPPSTTQTLVGLSSVDSLTNKTINGSLNTITNVSLTTGVTGILPIANGGTSQSTANSALNALLPSQATNAGKVLQTDGTNTSWATTSSGTTTVPNGGTGQTTLTNHGVLVGAGTSPITQLAAAAGGTVLAGQGTSSDPAFTATPTLGIAGTTLGKLLLAGNTSGTVTIQPQAAAGTFNFNLPITSGTTGQALVSGGGSSSAMTWRSFTTPTVQTFSATDTYTTPANVLYLEILMVGAGGSGGNGGTSATQANGTAGGSTSFGTSLLSVSGGAGGGLNVVSGGGIVTFNSPAIDIGSINGMNGTGFIAKDTTAVGIFGTGGVGGSSVLGPGGAGVANAAGTNATGSGGGGGGGGFNSTSGSVTYASSGGGAGGFIHAIIPPPLDATYAVVIGAGATGAAAGTNGFAGGNSSNGFIFVVEHYQ